MFRYALLALSLVSVSAASAQPASSSAPNAAAARASLVGSWEGELGYLDYSANRWFGIPVATFRKGRAVEVMTYAIRIDPGSRDATHWTMVEETKANDDNRPATLRLTTVRDGDKVETLKEVDFLDDDKSEWLTRNRTRLTRVGD